MCVRVMMILLITRRASKAPDMRSRSQRVAKSFFLSLSLSLSLGGSNLFFEGKNASREKILMRRKDTRVYAYDKKKKEEVNQK